MLSTRPSLCKPRLCVDGFLAGLRQAGERVLLQTTHLMQWTRLQLCSRSQAGFGHLPTPGVGHLCSCSPQRTHVAAGACQR